MTEKEMPQTPSAQIDYETVLKDVHNLEDIGFVVCDVISKLRESGVTEVGFVSGPVNNSKDPDKKVRYEVMKENMQYMREVASNLRAERGTPIVASTDIFDVAWRDLEEVQPDFPEGKRSERMKDLFDKILASGVTNVFMIRGWRNSEGALHEKKTAENLGIQIHDLTHIQE